MKRRTWAILAIVVAVCLIGWALDADAILQFLIAQELVLRDLVQTRPLTALGVGFLVYFVASLVPGTMGKAIVYGWLFGFWAALILVNVALTLAALLTFFAARFLLRDAVRTRFTHWIRRVDETVAREGALCLVTLRLFHAPYTLTNYAAGATQVPTRTFWWTTQIGLLPSNIVFVLAGSQLPTLRELVDRGPHVLVNLPLLFGLSAAAFLPVIIRAVMQFWARRRFAMPSVAENTGEHGEAVG